MNKLKFFLTSSLFIIALLGLGHQAYAEQLDNSVHSMFEKSKNDTKNKPEQPDKKEEINKVSTGVGLTFFDFVKMIVATVFVIALIYSILKFINKRNHVYKSSQLIENIGGTTLGANRSIQIVKIGKRLLIVGVGESIQLIKEIEDESEYKEIVESYNRKMDQLTQPSDIVTKVMHAVKMQPAKEKKQDSFAVHLKKQLQEISIGRKEMLKEIDKKGPEKNE
ncbi:flagellar biosynthetic protein FliO [Niallia sp. 01092]|uniref:flagellar biosynthetic protein FliO n=1 Tax=unclassified Niallia TaxID=2837522 RepID=UPI003FD4C9A4